MSKEIPYQCCPLCNGQGKTIADEYTSSIYQICQVCHGARIIPMYVVTAKEFTKDQIMKNLLYDIEMNLDDWCRTPLVMATKFRDKQFKQEKL